MIHILLIEGGLYFNVLCQWKYFNW